ncbi:MAG TPA: GNAT family N-acetyltransferase [Terriglobales bacterium]|nr:GNAT family N-acetyltransferase [Terriglobales bacterium]
MLSIRSATLEDVKLLSKLIRELAEYENELDQVQITEADLARDGFGPQPKFRVLLAYWDQEPAGYALFFDFYSTWRGRQMYLEDLFVRQAFRGRKIGKGLLAAVAGVATRENCHALRSEVLDWNHAAVEFYKSLGAEFLDSWRLVLLKDEELRRLAEIAP